MVSVLMGFFLAMILFPEAKAKAQKEIDVVVGIERLPNMEDIPRLPYLNRIIQETKRWFPVVPLGGCHKFCIQCLRLSVNRYRTPSHML